MPNNQKGFAPLYLLIGLVALMLMGGAYYFGKSSSTVPPKNIPTITQSPTPTKELTPSPTSTPSPSPTQNPTSCEVSDSSFCSILTALQTLIANKDFNNLAAYQDLYDVTCTTNPDVPSFTVGLCEGMSEGQITQGYNIGHNAAEGAFYSKKDLISTINDTFVKKNYKYNGSLVQNNKGEIVYLSDDKKNLFVLWLKKTDQSGWRIKVVLLGWASNDYINLDPITFSYMNL